MISTLGKSSHFQLLYPTTRPREAKRTGTRVPHRLFALCSTESLIKSVSHVCWLPQQELGKAQRSYIVRSTANETSDRSVNRDEECLKGTIVNDLDSLARLFADEESARRRNNSRSRFANASQPELPLEETETLAANANANENENENVNETDKRFRIESRVLAQGCYLDEISVIGEGRRRAERPSLSVHARQTRVFSQWRERERSRVELPIL
ncbi:hypothetical protein K0M31_012258 [Melipona bicolor]|uniref:Uncharacterized protein n=1 Tax=Melipona bicolor TaxID=60889 RepID=A0AA40KHL6_9HYME|nr:hypothetical protein K0M31_012258 [Melipona bicolor]